MRVAGLALAARLRQQRTARSAVCLSRQSSCEYAEFRGKHAATQMWFGRPNVPHAKLCGQGPRAEARAARRLPRSRRSAAREDVGRRDAGHAWQLIEGLQPRPEAGPHQLQRGVSPL
jgi:hypothetical protein